MNKKSVSNFIHPIPVLKDNIIWIWVSGDQAVVIDPALSHEVKNWLNARNIQLVAVLQTHHHEDHIGGTQDLIKEWPKADVIASKSDIDRISFQTISVENGDTLDLMGKSVKILEVSGHTKNHLAYFLDLSDNVQAEYILFCGDTLFGGGCGRLFEGTAEEMFNSLKLLSNLPPETKVYCAHEYTEDNLKWALSIRSDNYLIRKRLEDISKKRRQGLLSLPSTISKELETNLFIKAKNVGEFANLRRNKDNWKG